jgi:hypothetical protein
MDAENSGGQFKPERPPNDAPSGAFGSGTVHVALDNASGGTAVGVAVWSPSHGTLKLSCVQGAAHTCCAWHIKLQTVAGGRLQHPPCAGCKCEEVSVDFYPAVSVQTFDMRLDQTAQTDECTVRISIDTAVTIVAIYMIGQSLESESTTLQMPTP